MAASSIFDPWGLFDPISQPMLFGDHAVWPLSEFVVNKYGAHNAVRSNPSQGRCGPRPDEPLHFDDTEAEQKAIAARYPCTHKGADLSATEGTEVVVPHDGWLLYCGPADHAPFIGYGPNVALIAHADMHDSFWHRAWKWATGRLVDIGDFPAETVAGSYSLIAHFDIDNSRNQAARTLPADLFNSSTKSNKANANHWYRMPKDNEHVVMLDGADGASDSRRVFAGTRLGWVNGGMGHVHWEIRNSPLATKSGRFDPIATWQQMYGLALPGGSRVAAPSSSGGAGLLLLLALLAFGDSKRRR